MMPISKKSFSQDEHGKRLCSLFALLVLVHFVDNDWKYDGSANFITYLIQGNDPSYGDGTSASADLYLDFGGYGVFFGLFIFGLLFQFFDK